MRYISLMFFLFLINSVFAQFNTVLPNTNSNIEQTSDKLSDKIDEKIVETKNDLKERKFLSLPLKQIKVTSIYGYRTDPFNNKKRMHKGIDLSAKHNIVYSVMAGKVVKSGKSKSFGNYIEIEHGDFKSLYAHLAQILVSNKQIVKAGEPIAISGNTGRSLGHHLHFELKYKGKHVDPAPFLKFINDIFEKKELLADVEIRK